MFKLLLTHITILFLLGSCSDALNYTVGNFGQSSESDNSIIASSPHDFVYEGQTDGIVSTKWTQVSGPGIVTFNPDDSIETTISADTYGSYIIRLDIVYSNGEEVSENYSFIWQDLTSPNNFRITTPLTTVGSLRPTISWTNSSDDSGVVFYTVSIYESDCSSLVQKKESLSSNIYTVQNNLTDNTSYCLSVVALDGSGNATPASNDKLSFSVDTSLSIVLGGSIEWANEASDGYINAAEAASSSPVAALSSDASYVSFGFSSVLTDPQTCDASKSYSSTIPTISSVTTDGDYTICAKLTDAAGNSIYLSAPSALQKDTIAPSLGSAGTGNAAVFNPYLNNADYVGAALDVMDPAPSIIGADTVEYDVVPMATVCSAAPSYSATFPQSDDTSFASGDIDYKVCAYLRDNAGNESYVEAQPGPLKADVSIPTVSAPSANILAANASAYVFSGTCSEDTRTVTVGGDYSDTITCSSGTYSKTVNLSGLAEGTRSFTLDHDDQAGNSAVTVNFDLEKDTVIPTIAVTSSSDINIANQSAYTFSGTCSEDTETVVLGGDISEGTHFTSNPTCSSGNFSVSVNFSALPSGNVNITVDHTDPAGNTASQISHNLTKNTTLPTVTITAVNVTSANVAAVTVSGNCSENGQTVTIGGGSVSATPTCSAGIYSASVNFTAASEGNVNVTADHMDASSNVALQASANFFKDTISPVMNISGGPADPSNDTALDVTVSSTGSDAVEYQYKLLSGSTNCSGGGYNGSWISVSTKITSAVSTDASKRLCVIGRDAVGNTTAEASAATHDWTFDSTAPTATISNQPANPSNTANLDVTVGGTDVVDYTYAFVASSTSCAAASYSGSYTLVSTKITDAVSGSEEKDFVLRVEIMQETYNQLQQKLFGLTTQLHLLM